VKSGSLALVILNFNVAENAIRLLESLKIQTDKDFSIVIADNGSTDVNLLEKYAVREGIKLIRNGANLGYGAGNNAALNYVFGNGAEWAFIINPDTLVSQDFIEKLKKALSLRSGIVGLPLNEGGRTAYAGRLDWLKTNLEHVYEPLRADDFEVCYPIGGALAISRSAFEKTGGFDEEYLIYFEDADFAIKAREAGVKVEFALQPIIQHSVSQSAKKVGSPLILRYHFRNSLHFNHKRGSGLVRFLVWLWSLYILCKQQIKLGLGKNPVESSNIKSGVMDFYNGRMGLITNRKKIGIECEQIEGEMWGIGRILTNLLENITSRPELRNEYEFHLYFKEKIPDFEYLKDPIFRKEIISQPFRHKSFVLYYYVFLPMRLWRAGLDVMYFPNYMLPIIFSGKSLLLLTDDVYHEMRSPNQRFHHRLAYWVFTTWGVWFAARILAISKASKRELVRLFGIKPERILVDHLAVGPYCKPEINKNGDYILFAGQSFPRRHLAETMRAFEIIGPEFPRLRMIIIGPDKYKPPQIEKIKDEINRKFKEERIRHYLWVKDTELTNLFSHALATVYVSSREAFGLPPLEALAQGSMPIIADNALGHEIFGDNAFFVSAPYSAVKIADVLRDSLTNKTKREKILSARPVIVANFTWRRHADRFMEAVNLIING